MTDHILFPTLAAAALLLSCGPTDQTTDPTPIGEWVQVLPAQSAPFSQAISFVDQFRGIVVGDSGLVLRTTDGGDTWTRVNSGTSQKLISLSYVYPDIAWAAGGGATLGKTTDGGATWTWQTLGTDTSAAFLSMTFHFSQYGWIADNKGRLYRTSDAGSSWTPQTSGITQAITALQSVSTDVCYAISLARRFHKTTDGGLTWSDIELDSLVSGGGRTLIFTDMSVVTPDRVCITTDGAASSTIVSNVPVIVSSDANRHWQVVETSEALALEAVQFVDDRFGWAVGISGIIHSSDGGSSWTCQLHSPHSIFVDVAMRGPLRGWAVTFNGAIYRYQQIQQPGRGEN